MDIQCAACRQKSAAVEAGHSLCLPHLHAWLLSKEGKTAKRLYSGATAEERTRREHQVFALMKLFLTQQEPWASEAAGVIVL